MGIIDRLTQWIVKRGFDVSHTTGDAYTFADLFGGARSSAGKAVTPDSALTCSAFYSAVNLIASAAASLPCKAYARTDAGREVASGHPAMRIVSSRPNPQMNPFHFWYWMFSAAIIRGTGYAEIVRDNAGRPIALYPIHNDFVKPGMVVVGRGSGQQTLHGYEIAITGQEPRSISADQMLRIFVWSRDGLDGSSVIDLMRETVGIQLAMDEYKGRFFANNAMPSGVIQSPSMVTDEQIEQIRRTWLRAHGGASNASKPGVLPPGFTFTPVSLTADDAQLIDSSRFQVSEFARWMNIPVTRLRSMETATWGNYESEAQAFIQETLMPWLVAAEQECSKLFTGPERSRGMYVKWTVNALMRADVKTRAEYYGMGKRDGWLSANEIRAFEELNSIGEQGDAYTVQAQMVDTSQTDQTEGSRSDSPWHPVILDSSMRVAMRERDRLRRAIKPERDRAQRVIEFYSNFPVDGFDAIRVAFQRVERRPLLLEAAVNAWRDTGSAELEMAIANGDDLERLVDTRMQARAEQLADAIMEENHA